VTDIIRTYVNPEYGIEARIARLDDGRYSVTLRDIEADAVLPVARIVTDIETAAEHARLLTTPRGRSASSRATNTIVVRG
jgi:hypothetical protein